MHRVSPKVSLCRQLSPWEFLLSAVRPLFGIFSPDKASTDGAGGRTGVYDSNEAYYKVEKCVYRRGKQHKQYTVADKEKILEMY